jgi:iron-siderophore transport system substrate-binding protein
MALQVGASLGRKADAEKLVQQTKDAIAKETKANPKFASSTAVLIDPDDDGGVYIFAENDVRTRFLGDLGFTMPAEIEKLTTSRPSQFYAQISAERLDLLDLADVLILVAVRKPQVKQLTSSRSYQNLKAVKEKRLVTIDDPDLAIAMSYSSVASTPYQLREVVPRLREALA